MSTNESVHRLDLQRIVSSILADYSKDTDYVASRVNHRRDSFSIDIATLSGSVLNKDVENRLKTAGIKSTVVKSPIKVSFTSLGVWRDATSTLAARLLGVSSAKTAASFDAFSNRVTIYVPKINIQEAMTRSASLGEQFPGSTVGVEELQEVTPVVAIGGTQIWLQNSSGGYSSDFHCTIGFGFWDTAASRTGVSTAGHCSDVGNPPSAAKIWLNGETTTQTLNERDGFVYDSQYHPVPATWWVWTGAGWQDMDSTPIYSNTGALVCWFGQRTNLYQCNFTSGISHPVSYPTTGVHYFSWVQRAQTYTPAAQQGDSGGPVWQPGGIGTPTGFIAARGGDETMYFVDASTQMSGTPWVML